MSEQAIIEICDERVFIMNSLNNCFFLPKELLTKEYSNYSLKSKMLFSIVLTEAENGTSINELAELIEKIGSRNVSSLYKQAHKELSEHQTRSEDIKNVQLS